MMSELPIIDAMLEEEPVSEKVRTLGTLARLLSYPGNHYVQLIEMLYLLMQNHLPEAAKEVSEFAKYVEQLGEYELEEAYTRTFDVNPSCALEVGWHLFGEDYLRGQFLVKMRGELAKFEIQESTELPDHLTHVLAVIGAMSDDEAKPFVHSCVFPAW
jgi:nitrate reductase assembly molybdenum cofactor insertion protein NarJ